MSIKRAYHVCANMSVYMFSVSLLLSICFTVNETNKTFCH